MSEYFLPLVSSTSDRDRLRAGDLDKFDRRFCQVSESIPAHQKSSVELRGNATLDPCSCNSLACVCPLTTGMQFQKWHLGKPFHLPISSVQVEPSFFPSISLNGCTGEHFINDLAGTEGKRIELIDQNLVKANGLLSRNEYLWIQKLQDSQPCRAGTMFSIDELKDEEYVSNLLKTSQGSLNDLEVEHETVYHISSSEPAKFLEEETEARDKMHVHLQPFRESDAQELKRRTTYARMEDHTVDSAPNLVHEHILSVERIFRPRGVKDRHSKVRTSKGLRDRRVRLSVSTAIQFYDIQDRLGYDHPSKAIDWLMIHAKAAIDELRASHINPPARSSVLEPKSFLGFKSPINEEIATYSATSQISDSSCSGSVPIGTLDGYDELPECQALASQGLSLTSRTNEASRSSLLRAKDTSSFTPRAKEKEFCGNEANNRISKSGSNSDGSGTTTLRRRH